MTDDAKRDESKLWPEPWASQVVVQAATIEHHMKVAAAAARKNSPTGELDARQQAAVDAINDLLASVRSAAGRRRWLRWRGPFDWWRGTSIEHAYQSMHAARIFLIELSSPAELDALIPSVFARLATSLPPEDVRRVKLERLATYPRTGRTEVKRAAIKQAMDIAYDASDQMHARVRGFRNIIVVTAFAIAVLTGGLVWIVSESPAAIPLCFQPNVTASDPPPVATTRTVCPSGEDPAQGAQPSQSRRPGRQDVQIVAGLGLLGGALAAAVAIRNLRGSSTPYGVPMSLAVLKVPSGALTAVAGMLLLGGGFVPGFSELDSQRQILAYALVFGYAQQLATRFVDDRAQKILNAVPSKDPEAKQPTPSSGEPPDETPPAAGEAPPPPGETPPSAGEEPPPQAEQEIPPPAEPETAQPTEPETAPPAAGEEATRPVPARPVRRRRRRLARARRVVAKFFGQPAG